LLQQSPISLRQSGSKWELYTFAGGRINTLLARALARLLCTEVSNDNFSVDIKFGSSQPIEENDVWNALKTIAQPDFFSPDQLIQLAQGLPRGRLSKFQPLLPAEQEARFLIDRLFDPQGVQELLRRHLDAWIRSSSEVKPGR
ncbi:MAG: hypothetical protein H8D43_01270, partial [Chloroflexi bacterium]|nr:hypothetical protein [Chloroflexota bacterium]